MKGFLKYMENKWMIEYDTYQDKHWKYPFPLYGFIEVHIDSLGKVADKIKELSNVVEFDIINILGGRQYAQLK